MANYYSLYDETGNLFCVVDINDGTTPDSDDYPVGGGYVLGEYNPDEYYISGLPGSPTVSARPSVSASETYTISNYASENVTIALPHPSTVIDTETSTEYTTSTDPENFVFTSSRRGVFVFVIIPPFPYRTLTVEIRCNDNND